MLEFTLMLILGAILTLIFFLDKYNKEIKEKELRRQFNEKAIKEATQKIEDFNSKLVKIDQQNDLFYDLAGLEDLKEVYSALSQYKERLMTLNSIHGKNMTLAHEGTGFVYADFVKENKKEGNNNQNNNSQKNNSNQNNNNNNKQKNQNPEDLINKIAASLNIAPSELKKAITDKGYTLEQFANDANIKQEIIKQFKKK